MSHNWRNYNKILKFSDAKNTRKIDAFFSKQKSSETWELEVNEQSENRPSSSYTVIDFVEQSESRPLASISSAKKNITVIPLSIRTEKNNYFFLCPKTKGNYFHTVRKFRESLMPIICQKVSIPKYTMKNT